MTQEPNLELSAREVELLGLVATGATNQQIAQALHISVNTVKAHLRNIFGKLGVESRTEATLIAIQRGYVAMSVGDAASAADELSAEPRAAEPADDALPAQPPTLPKLLPTWGKAQWLAPWVVLALVLLAILWPAAPAAQSGSGGRLVDAPLAEAQQPEAGVSSRWATHAQMPTPRGRFAQVYVNGHIYVISGLAEGGWTPRVEMYDPAQDLWAYRADKPTAVANIGAVVVDGLVYTPGGLDATNQTRDILEVYDPQADAWRALRPLPAPLCAYAIVAAGQGFYLLGGWDGAHYQDRVLYYDVANDAWSERGRLPKARGFAAAALAGGHIYLTGGYDGANELRDSFSFAADPADKGAITWQQHAPMRFGRAGHVLVAIQGSLYAIGGGWDRPFAYNERYDIASDAWATFESPIVGEWRSLGASLVETGGGSFIYVIGGWSGRYLGAVRAYQALFRVYLP